MIVRRPILFAMTAAACVGAACVGAACVGAAGSRGPDGDPGPTAYGAGSADTVLTADGSGGSTWRSAAALTAVAVAGRLGLGTAAPQFDVHAIETSELGVLLERYGGTPAITFREAHGTPTSPTASDNALGELRVMGYGATRFSPGSKAALVVTAGETWTDTAQGTRVQLVTTPTGATGANVRMIVSAGGHVAQYSEAPVASACGAGAALAGAADSNGAITVGAGASGCTITFAAPYLTPPTCVLHSRAGRRFGYAVSTTAITVTTIDPLDGTTLDYLCHGL